MGRRGLTGLRGLRGTVSQWASSEEQEARDLRHEHARGDVVPISAAGDREVVRLRGTLHTVTLRPRGGVPALEAELDDGTGVVTLVWLGRRRIAGIQAGRAVCARGRLGTQEGRRVMYNPRYELMP